jgi:hypothetical protein
VAYPNLPERSPIAGMPVHAEKKGRDTKTISAPLWQEKNASFGA